MLTIADIDAIVGGYHGDPFRVLGPHPGRKSKAKQRWEVRAYLPQAASAEVIIAGRDAAPMTRKHDGGFFTASFDEQPPPYRLRLARHDGSVIDIDDPYRFGPLLSAFDLHLHAEGTNFAAWNMLGAHIVEHEGVSGVRFTVWAPNALAVLVTADFNDWDRTRHPMRLRDGGVWELFIPGIGEGARYKYFVKSRERGYEELKSDPYAFATEAPPLTASIVAGLGKYEWQDAEWLDRRANTDWLRAPVSIYEVHLESWMRKPGGVPLTYREMADSLVSYVADLGYTHIELLPVSEHPFSGSWGYQVTGYFAPTARFGPKEDFQYFVDRCHRAGIGVIIDWVPAHFPKDAHGLAYFDGTALYEHSDPRQGEHRDWGTLIFNFGRSEVREFLISNALFWLKEYHIDGLRVDAVASMLYLDYSRPAGEWVPNRYGGNENLEAISFLRRFNELAHEVPGAITIAEESTAFAGVSRPVYLNGLGFTMKWNMGWMHDMLHYISEDPVYRKYHHNNITFSLLYAFTENFVLPVSHDEVVHGKGSLIGKMPGDQWQKFANARAFLGYMYTHPGKKLSFMGAEIGQYAEWNNEASVEWDLLTYDPHRGLQNTVRALNRLYRSLPQLYEVDFHHEGFEWIDFHDIEHSTIAFNRYAADRSDPLVVICNFTPVPRNGYEVGVADAGWYEEIFNSDAAMFGGSNMGNGGGVPSRPSPRHGRRHSISVTLPPLGVLIFRRQR